MNIGSINSLRTIPRFGDTSKKAPEIVLTDEEFEKISKMPDSEWKKLPKEIKTAWLKRSYDESPDEYEHY